MNYIENVSETPDAAFHQQDAKPIVAPTRYAAALACADFLAAALEAANAENAGLKAALAEGPKMMTPDEFRQICPPSPPTPALRKLYGDYLAAKAANVVREFQNEHPELLVMTQSAIAKAPPGVKDWLKAFGVYDGGSHPPSPASEPEKPVDPRSETLSRALNAQRNPDAYGR